MRSCLMGLCLRGTLFFLDFGVRGNNSVVECDLAKVEVAGSNPVSRSIPSEEATAHGQAHFFPDPLSFTDGAVAKW